MKNKSLKSVVLLSLLCLSVFANWYLLREKNRKEDLICDWQLAAADLVSTSGSLVEPDNMEPRLMRVASRKLAPGTAVFMNSRLDDNVMFVVKGPPRKPTVSSDPSLLFNSPRMSMRMGLTGMFGIQEVSMESDKIMRIRKEPKANWDNVWNAVYLDLQIASLESE